MQYYYTCRYNLVARFSLSLSRCFFFGEACKMAAEESEIVSASEVSNVSNTEESLLEKIQAKFGEEIKTAFESKSVFLTGSVHS